MAKWSEAFVSGVVYMGTKVAAGELKTHNLTVAEILPNAQGIASSVDAAEVVYRQLKEKYLAADKAITEYNDILKKMGDTKATADQKLAEAEKGVQKYLDNAKKVFDKNYKVAYDQMKQGIDKIKAKLAKLSGMKPQQLAKLPDVV